MTRSIHHSGKVGVTPLVLDGGQEVEAVGPRVMREAFCDVIYCNWPKRRHISAYKLYSTLLCHLPFKIKVERLERRIYKALFSYNDKLQLTAIFFGQLFIL